MHSTFKLWESLLADTKQHSKYHQVASEIASQHVASKFDEIIDDIKRIFQKCKRNSLDLTTPKKLIYNVDGMACSKEILAIMGASGAGKTTLLNLLNFRNRGKLKIEGEIRVNGALVKSVEDISAVSGYVQQDDLFIGCLTVKEHLVFQV